MIAIPQSARDAVARHYTAAAPSGPPRTAIRVNVVLTRQALVDRAACPEGLALFDAIAPSGVWRGEWTLLHGLWLAVAYPAFAAWARDNGLVPWIVARRANLYGANLYGANLRGAYLYAAPSGWERDPQTGRLRRPS